MRLTLAALLVIAAFAAAAGAPAGAASGFGCKLVVERAITGQPNESELLVGGCASPVTTITGSLERGSRAVSAFVIDGPLRHSTACLAEGATFSCRGLEMKIGQVFVVATRPQLRRGAVVRVVVRADTGDEMSIRARVR